MLISVITYQTWASRELVSVKHST